MSHPWSHPQGECTGIKTIVEKADGLQGTEMVSANYRIEHKSTSPSPSLLQEGWLEPLAPSPGWGLQAHCPGNQRSREKLSPGGTLHPSTGGNVTSLTKKDNEVSTWTEHVFLSSQRGMPFRRRLIPHTAPDTPGSALVQKSVLKQSVHTASSFQRCPCLSAIEAVIKTGGVSQEKKSLKKSHLLTA